jgi:hypothetical protein
VCPPEEARLPRGIARIAAVVVGGIVLGGLIALGVRALRDR